MGKNFDFEDNRVDVDDKCWSGGHSVEAGQEGVMNIDGVDLVDAPDSVGDWQWADFDECHLLSGGPRARRQT